MSGAWHPTWRIGTCPRGSGQKTFRDDAPAPSLLDGGARGETVERFEQNLDALVLDELPEVEDRRSVLREEVLEVHRHVLRFPRERGERLVARLGTELVDVDARWDDLDALGVAADVIE